MKIRLGILIVVLAIPLMAYGHTEIFFPKLFSPAELANTGFVLLNPDPATATVYFYLVGADGKAASPPTILTIGKGWQLAKLGSELFPNLAAGGWVYVVNDTEGMQAFWLNYDSAITFLDGAEAAQYDTLGADQVIPLVAGQAELSVINPNGLRSPLTIRLFGNEGQLGAPFTGELPIVGGLRADLSTLFSSSDLMQARYIRIQSAGLPLASTILIRGFLAPADSAVVNGVNVSSGSEIVFPHVVTGNLTGARYTTVIGIANLSDISQSVTIVFNPEEGSPIQAVRTIVPSGALRESAESLFNLPAGFQSGWLRITGSAPLTGFAAYADSVAGGIAVVPAGTAQTSLFFSHIAEGPPQWQTGVALLNTGSTPADIEVYALSPSGSLIGGAANVPTARFTLEPGKKAANVIHEWIPQVRGVNGGFVYVRTTNNVPLYGIELFYTEDLKVLSNVAAGRLLPGIAYAPPSP